MLHVILPYVVTRPPFAGARAHCGACKDPRNWVPFLFFAIVVVFAVDSSGCCLVEGPRCCCCVLSREVVSCQTCVCVCCRTEEGRMVRVVGFV